MPNRLAVKEGRPVVPKGLTRRWPQITDAERRAVLRVLDEGVLSGTHAPEIESLEREFADYIGVRHCLASNSGTAALHMSIAAAGVGPGDEVITSAFTFLASGLAVLHHNAIPVFADIEPQTFNISPSRIRERITPRTKAIVPVHIHGLPADMEEILAIARQYNLIVIEDAAQAHGATYRGQRVGSLGEMGAFSIQSSKNLPAGEGGLFVTNDDRLARRANCLRMFGEEASDTKLSRLDPEHPLDELRDYNALTVGWMYRTTALTAALARCQLARLEENNRRAQRNAEYLTRRLSEFDVLSPPFVPSDRTSIFHKYRVRLHPERWTPRLEPKRFRNALLKALRAEGVEVVLWQAVPVPSQVVFQEQVGYGKGCPWTCQGSAVRYRSEEYPETVRLLDSSIVVGSQSAPLAGQDLKLMEYYADAFEKVLSDKDALIQMAGREDGE